MWLLLNNKGKQFIVNENSINKIIQVKGIDDWGVDTFSIYGNGNSEDDESYIDVEIPDASEIAFLPPVSGG